MECAAGNELLEMYDLESKLIICGSIRRSTSFYYEYHYSPHKLALQNIRVGDQKLMILAWP